MIQSSQWIGWWSQTAWSRLEPMWVFMGTPPAPFMALLKEVQETMDRVYPQLSGVSVMLNPPAIFKATFALFKPFMSKRALARVRFCPGDTIKEPIARCPFVAQCADAKALPAFLGGDGGCPAMLAVAGGAGAGEGARGGDVGPE